ncbi:hypothetical protein [Dyadobacter sp. BHUBP1]|uniref:hypothetical protein n=1 Tax=Dyadobacter sp. BHUBP1 TaxID=3424178 RepID=UPI003D331874
MIKTMITPENTRVSLVVPASFVGKQVEIIAFTVEESVDESVEQNYILTHYASQKYLEKDWLTDEEDEAWQNL